MVAVGRWQTIELKALINGLPLGPNGIKVYVDKVVNPNAYGGLHLARQLWRVI